MKVYAILNGDKYFDKSIVIDLPLRFKWYQADSGRKLIMIDEEKRFIKRFIFSNEVPEKVKPIKNPKRIVTEDGSVFSLNEHWIESDVEEVEPLFGDVVTSGRHMNIYVRTGNEMVLQEVCHYNLLNMQRYAKEYRVPVYYFNEYLVKENINVK